MFVSEGPRSIITNRIYVGHAVLEQTVSAVAGVTVATVAPASPVPLVLVQGPPVPVSASPAAYDRIVRDALRRSPDLAILNLWTPAHIGTVGNELADEAAKRSTTSDPDPALFVSLTTVRQLIHRQVLSEWSDRWKRTKSGRQLRAVDPSPPSLIPLSLYSTSTLSRKTSSIIAQLRTDFTPLNAYRFKTGFIQSPACEACGAARENRAHFLLDCPAWEPHRRPLYAACYAAGYFGPLHVAPLLNEPKVLSSLAKFLDATGRFEQQATL
ncbi:hypothetical protein B0H16DRAFT_1728890 [Mycena metata]|uniref:RNase H type-1 domain-containing protein n=1 Tax=Mycena metata TaxID=1033252 RepID=A0AAD7MZZ1_9AGAR|nr:hypothetical protein B0H16DRAFT_1728890 [Mycena metata]